MKWYTAYLHRTEEILACGTAQQVAEALGMKMGSFYTARLPEPGMEKPQI